MDSKGTKVYLSNNLQQKIIPVKQFIVTRSAKRAAIRGGLLRMPIKTFA
jgi:hypothetical protein